MRSSLNRVNVALCTAPDRRTARRLGRALVEEGLAACVQLLPIYASIYRWKGKMHEDREILLLVKTLSSHTEKLRRRLRALHPYQTPEIVFLPVRAVDADYARWIAASLSQGTRSKGR